MAILARGYRTPSPYLEQCQTRFFYPWAWEMCLEGGSEHQTKSGQMTHSALAANVGLMVPIFCLITL